MAFGDRIKARREELALSRPQLADRLGVTPSTVSNYETGVSFPKEEMMLRLFDCLETDPNTLFQDSFRRGADVLTQRERQLLEQYRSLSPLGRESVQTMVEALRACQQESAAPEQEPRVIPLYRTLLNGDVIDGILSEEKREVDNVIISTDELNKYFGKEVTPAKMKEQIIALLDEWKEKQPPELAKPEKKHELDK